MAKKKNVKHKELKIFPPPNKGPKVLLFDIETIPLLGYFWSIWQQNVALNQIEMDWSIVSWSAKWLDDAPNKTMYMDQRNAPKLEDDKVLLQHIWNLLDKADIVIAQNGKNFDHKKLNARFILNGMQPPSTYKIIDTMLLAKKHFAFTSNKLEYLSDKLCTKFKKLKHQKFPGFELWQQCMKGNLEAFKEMEKYNKHDVLALEELYKKLIPWENSINFNTYSDDLENTCKCGSTEFYKNGFYITQVGRYQKHKCKHCGAESRDRENLLSDEKRESLKVGTTRT